MVKFPNSKINLGLRVTGKRADGYHNIQTIFYPLPFYDVLEIIPGDGVHEVSFTQTGIQLPGSDAENLCIKAYRFLKKEFPSLPSVKMHLHKVIPAGAGLGGGSSDASSTLMMLNEIFNTGLDATQLSEIALMLGSDCPFFISNTASYAEGRGELLTPVQIDLSTYRILVVNPGIHITTKNAFSLVEPSAHSSVKLTQIIVQPVERWQELLVNQFENPVFKLYPQIASIKEMMIQHGALYASLSGSGSTVFGIFREKPENHIPIPSSCFQKWI